ncbi:ferredoxin--NADP reductase [Flavisolibacter tropicus]|uniref:Oxidoreductase n=1 Tax=Flavisolibacter tropicus TaxID=1492898 RepID=A0A172TY62_9BACT|nr:ferredoxin--NADP reductase [Flavisolibacter tropicus]ANE51814.1 oxidoreductase [Flavisolibacter tropicus]
MQPTPTPLYKTITITAIKEEVKGFKTISFATKEALPYRSGQYLTLVDYVGAEEVRRSYSITSSPELNEPLTIGVKRIENGLFSRKLVDLAQPFDTWLTTGSGGFFTLPEDVSSLKQLFFLAAGSGITPIYSLIKTVLYKHPHLHIVLIYSNSSTEKALFRHELEQLAQQHPKQVTIEFLYSNAPNLNRARLHRDLFLQLLEQHVTVAINEVLFYICGPEAYMRMCTYILQEHNVPKEQIKRENFIIHTKTPHKIEPPDKGVHQVTIYWNQQQIQFPAGYPQTILSAAEAAGYALPYSCRSGQCGNCVAHCKKGQVWMSYNEVLTEKDLAKGLILTCTGSPMYGDVTLEL